MAERKKIRVKKPTFFTPTQVLIATAFFGPVAGGIMAGLTRRRAKVRDWPVVLVVPTIILIGFQLFLIAQFELSILVSGITTGTIGTIIFFLYQRQFFARLLVPIKPEGMLNVISVCLISTFVEIGIIEFMLQLGDAL